MSAIKIYIDDIGIGIKIDDKDIVYIDIDIYRQVYRYAMHYFQRVIKHFIYYKVF